MGLSNCKNKKIYVLNSIDSETNRNIEYIKKNIDNIIEEYKNILFFLSKLNIDNIESFLSILNDYIDTCKNIKELNSFDFFLESRFAFFMKEKFNILSEIINNIELKNLSVVDKENFFKLIINIREYTNIIYKIYLKKQNFIK